MELRASVQKLGALRNAKSKHKFQWLVDSDDWDCVILNAQTVRIVDGPKAAIPRIAIPAVSDKKEKCFVLSRQIIDNQNWAERCLFARGDVVIEDGQIHSSLLLINGDIALQGKYRDCLVIASGTVKLSAHAVFNRCHIITGASVIRGAGAMLVECQISENDCNPLGYIRWSDSSKDKIEPKKK